MRTSIKSPYIPIPVFLWLGFVGAISFMEAWLKFQAPGITVPLGLGIGKLVFGALNKVEWVLAVIITIQIYRSGRGLFIKENMFLLISVGILAIQTFVLLPLLDRRATAIIAGAEVGDSVLHFYYVGLEMVKVVCLFTFGYNYLRNR